MGLSQTQFAAKFGFSLDSIQNWEQGHRRPEGPARVLLVVIAKNPKAVEDALRAS
jgi:putative transcriptional regulator